MNNIVLTYKQYRWLASRGGRGIEDVFCKNGVLFVYIGEKIVPIPKSRSIREVKKNGFYYIRSNR